MRCFFSRGYVASLQDRSQKYGTLKVDVRPVYLLSDHVSVLRTGCNVINLHFDSNIVMRCVCFTVHLGGNLRSRTRRFMDKMIHKAMNVYFRSDSWLNMTHSCLLATKCEYFGEFLQHFFTLTVPQLVALPASPAPLNTPPPLVYF